jgi:hypothetical protein
LIGTGDEGRTSATGGVSFIIDHLQSAGMVDYRPSQRPGAIDCRLTFAGWRRLEEIQRSTAESTTAFMAMKFGRALTDTLYLNHLKPAVTQAGFDLRRLDERPQPGLIDQLWQSRSVLGSRFRSRPR